MATPRKKDMKKKKVKNKKSVLKNNIFTAMNKLAKKTKKKKK